MTLAFISRVGQTMVYGCQCLISTELFVYSLQVVNKWCQLKSWRLTSS